MAGGGADFAPVRFSTDALPERDRIPVWREFFGPRLFHTEIELLSDAPFHADMTLRQLPGLCLVSQFNSPHRLRRTPALVADGNDDIGLVVTSSGGTASQLRREITYSAGEAVVATAAEVFTSVSPSATQFRCIHIPRAALAPLVANLDDAALLRTIPPGNEAVRLLMSYLQAVREELPLAQPELRHLAVTHVHDLVALAIGATRDGAALAEARGLRAARLEAIKADIIANLARRDLSIEFISRRQGLSARHIRRLFRAEDTSFSDFVLEQRLLRAHRLLTDPRYGAEAVSDIAYSCGFGDISHFNRAFRRRFGATPTDLRPRA